MERLPKRAGRWYSDDAKAVPLYREYNPNEPSCNHNYTADRAEHDALVGLGWVDEGVAWYGIDPAAPSGASDLAPAQVRPAA